MGNNPSQALNLGGQPGAYGDTFNAINLFHGADAWIYRGADGKEVRYEVPLDTQGWPTAFPVLNGTPQTIWANIFYTKLVPPGTYIVEWEGSGNLLPYQDIKKIGPNKYSFKYEPNYARGDDGITLRIEPTDPANTGSNIRNIKIYQEKYSDLIAMGEDFDPNWFQAIDGFRTLRMHDWQGTNFSKVTDWGRNDVTADQAFWVLPGRGMPYELLVKIANQTRSDLWINIPHMATDDYMLKAATYVKGHLNEDLRVYVEYTNEYWTDLFDQHQYLIDKGAAQFGDVPFANAQAYGARASEMTKIFKQVFASDQARLFPTVTLNHNAFKTQEAITMLTTPAYVAKGGKSPLESGVKFLATDGYFSWFNTDPATDRRSDKWIAKGKAGYADARDFLINEVKTDLSPAWVKGRTLADKYKLKFGVYEGGALLLNGVDSLGGNPKYTNFNERVQLSPEMKTVYEFALKEWTKSGSGPFAWYSDTGRWSAIGDYGLWNAPDFKPELRTKAIISANEKVEPWWQGDKRPASTFDNGLYDAGSNAADTMIGTQLADRLYGLPGNDKISGLNGSDILVGGIGNDAISGGNGGDKLVGGAGADAMDGGAGFDTASYQTSSRSVAVDLRLGQGLIGDAKGDTLKAIENLTGGTADDTLSGDNLENWIDGGGGNDQLAGRNGNDRIKGGVGDDTLTGGQGNDIFYLGPGKDKITDWKEGDQIVITTKGWAFGDPSQVIIAQVGANTKLTFPAGTETWELILQNTDATTISISDDFLVS